MDGGGADPGREFHLGPDARPSRLPSPAPAPHPPPRGRICGRTRAPHRQQCRPPRAPRPADIDGPAGRETGRPGGGARLIGKICRAARRIQVGGLRRPEQALGAPAAAVSEAVGGTFIGGRAGKIGERNALSTAGSRNMTEAHARRICKDLQGQVAALRGGSARGAARRASPQ